MGIAVKIINGIIKKDGEVQACHIECRALEALYREAFTLSAEDVAITIPLTEAEKLIEKARKSV